MLAAHEDPDYRKEGKAVRNRWKTLIARRRSAFADDSDAAAAPRNVLLFSGHMIDAPGRPSPRFPPELEPAVTREIARVLDDLGAGAADLAICGGACGGDLIFAELALQRDVPLDIYLPFDVPEFLEGSVDFAGEQWHERFAAVALRARMHVLPDSRAGAVGEQESPYERNNLKMLASAAQFGAERVSFVCLWDGRSGDGPGGTEHLLSLVAKGGGSICTIDPAKLQI